MAGRVLVNRVLLVGLYRTLAGGVLVFLVAWSIRARDNLAPGGSSHSGAAQGAILTGLALAALAFAASLLRLPRRPRRPQDEEVVMPTRLTVWEQVGLLVAAALLIPVLAIWGWTRLGENSEVPAPNVTAPIQHPLHGLGADESTSNGSVWFLFGLGVAMLVVLLGLSAAAGRRRRPPAGGPTAAQSVTIPAIVRGTDVETDPRRAVIAAYRSFEQEAATLGVPIDPPRTSGEITYHTISSHLVHPDTVDALTDLFRRARYSTEPVGETDRNRSEHLLAQLRQQMRRAP